MKQSEKTSQAGLSNGLRLLGLLGLMLALVLLLASSVWASYEHVATFGDSGVGGELNDVAGMAVNISGAGGVPPGTVYTINGKGARVLRYSAKGEFREAWGWGVATPEGGASEPSKEFQRCGPDGEPAHPTCYNGNIENGDRGDGIGQLNFPEGIAIDQATGYVYVFNQGRKFDKAGDVIQVFNADGSKLLTGFGEFAPEFGGGTFEENPAKFHGNGQFPIAVDDSGSVYVADGTADESRVMVFKPQSPGDYEHYVYTGRANDIAASHDKVNYRPAEPNLDSAGNLYTENGEKIYEFAAGEPDAPSCEYQVPGGGISKFTVNPETGEVFYYSEKNKKIHQLSACDSQGEFVERGAFAPEQDKALSFNPSLAYGGSRPPGILYDGGFIYASAEVLLPVVESESVSSVTSSTAVLGAQINPKGSDTDYTFQYITNAAYEANEPADRFAGASQAPIGGADLGSGQSSLGAATALAGLAPDTEYRYRVLATSHCESADEEKVCEAAGATQVFRTFPIEAPTLPDGRVYELVSPAQKNGGEVIPTDTEFGSCGGGCLPATIGTTFPMQSSPDGDAVVYEGFPFSFTEGASKFNEYLARRTPSGWQTTTLSPLLQGGEEREGPTAFNAELTRGVFRQGSLLPSLSPEAPVGYDNLYIQSTASPSMLSPLLRSESPDRHAVLTYAGASADLSHVFFEANDALTGETPFAPEAIDGGEKRNNLYESVNGELRLVNVLPGNAVTVPGASVGLRVPHETGDEIDLSHAVSDDGSRVFWSDESGQVYVRENGESTKAIPDPGKFLTASADGSKLLLRDGHLYDLETEAITDLTEGKGGFEGIVGQSEDLSHVYFVDTAVITGEEENDHGAKAQAGQTNLYSWHEGAVSFVGVLLTNGDNGDWSTSPSRRTAEASPDGRWVAFVSQAPLTGYDNTCTTFDFNLGQDVTHPCVEAFLYDSATGALTCPSCNPTGARPLGESALPLFTFARDYLPQPRYITDSGRLYFDSRDSLSPFDTNNGAADVYQYEPEGIGSCQRGTGCVSLISAGHEPTDSTFLSVDATGKNVFFTTRDQLALKDKDDLIDLYDARENGGIAGETETSREECQGEACQPQIVAPNDPTPGSSSFEGAGNLNEKPAAHKHKKKKHVKKHRAHKRSHRRANTNRGGAK